MVSFLTILLFLIFLTGCTIFTTLTSYGIYHLYHTTPSHFNFYKWEDFYKYFETPSLNIFYSSDILPKYLTINFSSNLSSTSTFTWLPRVLLQATFLSESDYLELLRSFSLLLLSFKVFFYFFLSSKSNRIIFFWVVRDVQSFWSS